MLYLPSAVLIADRIAVVGYFFRFAATTTSTRVPFLGLTSLPFPSAKVFSIPRSRGGGRPRPRSDAIILWTVPDRVVLAWPRNAFGV